MVIDLPVIHALLEDADKRGSYHHGEAHWRGVAQAGWYLAKADPRVDLDVVLAFAVLHDSRRENEFADPFHGPRAAERSWTLFRDGTLPLSEKQAEVLYEALSIHNGAHPSEVHSATVAACLDADRLNLWRVGHVPDPALLCTSYGRRPEVINWAENLCNAYCPSKILPREPRRDVRLLSWAELADAYVLLEQERGPSDPGARADWKARTFTKHYGDAAEALRRPLAHAEQAILRAFT